MNHKFTVVLLFIFAVTSLAACLPATPPATPNNASVNQTEPTDQSVMETDSSREKSDDRYIEYSTSALSDNADKRRVLFFYANWCPTCRPADNDFKQNSGQIPEDVVLIRVNYNDTETDDEEQALAEKYGVTYQHTFVQVDETGEEVAKWNGGQLDELLANIQ